MFTAERAASYTALDNAIAMYDATNWLPPMVEDDYRKARHTEYYADWLTTLTPEELAINSEIVQRL